jgi:hypothetical protein
VALKFREELIAAREACITPELPVKFHDAPASPIEFYIRQLENVRRIYEHHKLKDVTTMSPAEREEYRVSVWIWYDGPELFLSRIDRLKKNSSN